MNRKKRGEQGRGEKKKSVENIMIMILVICCMAISLAN
jgi:hypothetical protein